MDKNLFDAGAERAVISTIVKVGKDALIEIESLLVSNDFYVAINRAIFTCINQMSNEGLDAFDIDSIKVNGEKLGFKELFDNPKSIEYFEFLKSSTFNINTIRSFALQIKKLALARELKSRHFQSIKYLDTITGTESLAEILSKSEDLISGFVNGIDDSSTDIAGLGVQIRENVQFLIDHEPVQQIGIPSRFPIWDSCVGGIRRGTVHIIASRPKCGKSFMALNMARNIATAGIPVLIIDSELTKEIQQSRLICIDAECPIYAYETGQFKQNVDIRNRVVASAAKIESSMPLFYKSIAGMTIQETMMFIRRWLVKHVGFNSEGKANDCVVIYDYFKLTSSEGLNNSTPEHILLGLILTDFYTFCLKYDIPIVAFAQLNRTGIESENTDAIASSDRILWLCSSLSYLKNKDENDVSMNCGFTYGNKKLIVVETRHGGGFENMYDYINLHALLRPNISKLNATGHIREGFLYSTIKMTNAVDNIDDTTGSNSGDQEQG